MKPWLKISVTVMMLGFLNPANAIITHRSTPAEIYAELNQVSLKQAKHAINLDNNRYPIMQKLKTQYQGRIAGLYIEHLPQYHIVIRLTGTGRDATKYFAIKNHKGLYLPVEFQYGAKITKEQARERMPSAQALATRYFDTVQTVFYDEKTGEMNIEIKAKDTPEVHAKIEQLKQAWNNPDLPMNIRLVNYDITPL